MSGNSPIHDYVHKRFRETFGEPDNTLGRDDHWSLRPGAFKPAINILCNGGAEVAAVWVFDPHSKNDGVIRVAVETRDQVEAIILTIQQRLRDAQPTT